MEVTAVKVDFIPDNDEDERLPDRYRIRKDIAPGTFCFLTDTKDDISAIY